MPLNSKLLIHQMMLILHVMGDLIQSTGVMISAATIWVKPGEIDVAWLENELSSIDGVRGVHDLHVWAISASDLVGSATRGGESNVLMVQSNA